MCIFPSYRKVKDFRRWQRYSASAVILLYMISHTSCHLCKPRGLLYSFLFSIPMIECTKQCMLQGNWANPVRYLSFSLFRWTCFSTAHVSNQAFFHRQRKYHLTILMKMWHYKLSHNSKIWVRVKKCISLKIKHRKKAAHSLR